MLHHPYDFFGNRLIHVTVTTVRLSSTGWRSFLVIQTYLERYLDTEVRFPGP